MHLLHLGQGTGTKNPAVFPKITKIEQTTSIKFPSKWNFSTLNLLGLSNDLDSPLIQNDNNIKDKENNTQGFHALYLCQKPSDLNKIYKGKIDNNLLDQEKNNSEYFVIKPTFINYKLPKELKNIEKTEENKIQIEENGVKDIKDIKDSPPQEFKKAEKKKDNRDEENLIENTNNIPDLDLYIPIGFNRNDNPLKLKQKEEIKSLLFY